MRKRRMRLRLNVKRQLMVMIWKLGRKSPTMQMIPRWNLEVKCLKTLKSLKSQLLLSQGLWVVASAGSRSVAAPSAAR